MQLGFSTDNDVTHKTGALNHISGIGVPLQDTKKGFQDGFVVVNKFDNVQGDWFMSDFPMDYDPCSCLNQAKFTIAITLIKDSHITLEGNINATLTSIDNGAGTGPNAANSSDSRSTLNYLNGALTAGYTSYNGLTDFITNATKKDGSNRADVQHLGGDLATPVPPNTQPKSFFDSAAGVIPYLGSALSILDYFVGGGQEAGPQQVTVQPMALNGTIKLHGSITADLPWGGTDFRVPGSKLGTVLPQTPFYNEILGTFNLLEAPKFKSYDECLTDPSYDYPPFTGHYRLAQDLKYVVNPASGLIVHSIKAALVMTSPEAGEDFLNQETPGNLVGNFYTVEPTWRTDYVDAGCLTNYEFRDTYQTGPNANNQYTYPHDFSIKLLIDFERVDGGKHVLLVQKYPVEFIGSDASISLGATNSGCATPLLAPQSPTAIADFCNNNVKYTSAVAFRGNTPGPKKPRASQNELTQFTAFPNPVESTTTIRFAVVEAGRVHLSLRDGLGRTVRELVDKNLSPGLLDQQLDTRNLAPGIYYAVLQTNDHLQTLKIVVEKP